MATDERTPALLLDNVVKTYGPIRAVDGVSLKAFAGEFIALLGPNGAGKSTLFQLLSGLFVPDSGRIEVMGNDMRRDPVPALAKLGIVFQQPTLDLELSLTGNLLFHAGLHGLARQVAKSRIESELARLGLEARAVCKVEIAVQLLPAIRPEAATVAEILMAMRLALRPVSQVVLAHQAERTCHADEHAGIHQRVFQPKRTGKAVVDQAAMHAQRMP